MRAPTLYLNILLAAGVAFSFSGCTTVSSEVFVVPLRATVATATIATLDKNPAYVPAVRAIQNGIDAAIAQNATITPETIALFIKTVGGKNGLPPLETTLFTSLAQQIYSVYVATYKTTVVSGIDPKLLPFIQAFKDGLADGLASLPARP